MARRKDRDEARDALPRDPFGRRETKAAARLDFLFDARRPDPKSGSVRPPHGAHAPPRDPAKEVVPEGPQVGIEGLSDLSPREEEGAEPRHADAPLSLAPLPDALPVEALPSEEPLSPLAETPPFDVEAALERLRDVELPPLPSGADLTPPPFEPPPAPAALEEKALEDEGAPAPATRPEPFAFSPPTAERPRGFKVPGADYGLTAFVPRPVLAAVEVATVVVLSIVSAVFSRK